MGHLSGMEEEKSEKKRQTSLIDIALNTYHSWNLEIVTDFFKHALKPDLVKIVFILCLLIQVLFIVIYPYRIMLIVSDPYVDGMGGWSVDSPFFILNVRMLGFRVIRFNLSDGNEFIEMLQELNLFPEVVLLSPWHADKVNVPYLRESRIIVVGAEPLPDAPDNVTGVVLDPSNALTEIGRIAGEIARKEGKPALALYRHNIEGLVQAYEMTSGGEDPILEIPVSSSVDILPQSFLRESPNASTLLLLAGPMNILAYNKTQNLQQAVITEFAFANGYWNGRIIWSLEHDNRAMRRVVLAVIRGKLQKTLAYYPGRLKRGKKWFDSIRKLIL